MSKRVLITGGAGFIAHHFISLILKTTDWEVVSLDRLDFSGNLNRLQDELKNNPEAKRVKIVHHDLKAAISPWIATLIGKVDIIYHLAAGSHVDRSISHPEEFVMDNVIGTMNILQYARTIDGLEKFFYFSTDEVFGPAPVGVSYKEYDRYNSTNPYSASKAGGEELSVAWRNTYGLPVIVTHSMNLFAHRQHPEKFVPMTIANVRDGKLVSIHADPTCTHSGTRHYIHTIDASDALLFLTEKDFSGTEWKGKCPKFNIVGEKETSNLELAQMIANAQGKELKYELINFHSSRPGHDLRYSLDNSLMLSMGWKPKEPIETRIKEVVEWSLNHPEWLRPIV